MSLQDNRNDGRTQGSDETSAKRKAPAIEKAASVLDELSRSGSALSFGELAAQVPIARSSLHDLCTGLVRTGLVEKTSDGRYLLGLKIVELARNRIARMDIVSAFQSVCREWQGLDETIVLSVPSESDVVYVSFIDGLRPLAVRYQLGLRLPAAFTASGKAILATLPANEITAALGSSLEHTSPSGKRKNLSVLLTELETARQEGFSVDDEETAAGMLCFGAPVFGRGQEGAIGAVAVSLVKSSVALRRDLAVQVRQIAARISRLLGADDVW
ncbi:MAG: IclR family transcriptional regulator [Thermoleophilia bacterium]